MPQTTAEAETSAIPRMLLWLATSAAYSNMQTRTIFSNPKILTWLFDYLQTGPTRSDEARLRLDPDSSERAYEHGAPSAARDT
jgi:hypothetical protein